MDQKAVAKILHNAKTKKLEEITLSYCSLKSLPEEIGSLTNVKFLYLRCNRLEKLPNDIGKLKNLEILAIDSNKLEKLPNDICNLVKLKKLILRNNCLRDLPKNIDKLSNLEMLDLSQNYFSEFPQVLCKIKSLKSVNLSRNRIVKIDNEISKLTKLNHLNLSFNYIKSLPGEIGEITNIEELDVGHNNIHTLPRELCLLSNLTKFRIENNKLKEFPPEFGNLNRLEYLNFSNNRFTDLPEVVGNLTELEGLDLSGNPFKIHVSDVINKDVGTIITYLRNLAKGISYRYEAKLILLGDPDEGKTCLSRALRGLVFRRQPTTKGVDVRNWCFDNPAFPEDKDKKITLKIWDFEGQEINHQSHQFFLTERSLYILVFKGRSHIHMHRIEYWLDIIRSRVPDCKVTLVATECETRNPLFSVEHLEPRYQEMLTDIPFFSVGCKAKKGDKYGRNISELIDYISSLSSNLEVMGCKWPVSYSKAEKLIRKEIKKGKNVNPFISRNRLHELYSLSEINQVDYENVSKLFGDLGIITHFPDNFELVDFIVLNPEWLTKAISIALESPKLIQRHGECPHRWLSNLWKNEYPNLFPKFYACMKHFELCYQLENKRGHSLIPLRFPSTPIEPNWEKNPSFKYRRIRYRFKATPPIGLFSRFIVKVHHLIVKNQKFPIGIYWNNGVFISAGNGIMKSEALCSMDTYQRELIIIVRGIFPQNMIEHIHAFIKAVMEFYKGLPFERDFGCIHEDESYCEGYHQELNIASALNLDELLVCGKENHTIHPKKIVFGITSFAENPEVLENIDRKADFLVGQNLLTSASRIDEFNLSVTKRKKISKFEEAMLHQNRQLLIRDLLNALGQRERKLIPSLYSFTPTNIRQFKVKNIFNQKYILKPYCEYDLGPHPCEWSFELFIPRNWWVKASPLISISMKILTLVTHPSLTTRSFYIEKSQLSSISKDLENLNRILNILHEKYGIDSFHEISEVFITKSGKRKQDSKDYNLSNLLDLLDKDENYQKAYLSLAALINEDHAIEIKRRTFGDLQLKQLTNSTWRWLCPIHDK